VLNGDTIEVDIEGISYRVQYIGIDSPELGQPFEAECTTANRQLVGGQTVILVRDVSETDPFSRLLRYVYLQDGRMVNAEMVAGGYAEAVSYPPDTRYQGLFEQLEGEAQAAGRGIWGQPTPPPASPPVSSPPSGNCDPAYPDVCIPPPPPDLNCGDIPHCRFRVLPPDPHNFDMDGDGLGCESC
jgi:micrococcal nuclease